MTIGDIIITRDRGFVPRSIRVFMRKYRKRLGLPPAKVFNHCAVIIENDGNTIVAESAIKGVVATMTPAQYLMKHPDHKIMTWVEPLTYFEQEDISDIAMEYIMKGTRYDFKNFIDQIILITTGIWTGRKGEKSKRRLYCSELAAVCMDGVRASFDGKTWDVNPLDVEINRDLHEES